MITSDDRRTQRQRVLEELHAAGERGVCSTQWYATGIPNSRNVLSVLRAEGFHIDSATCPDHHGAPFARYRLRHGPERECVGCRHHPAQLTLDEAIA